LVAGAWLQDLEEGDASVLEPFQKMLQFALEPLLLYVDPIADQSGRLVHYCPDIVTIAELNRLPP